MSTIVPVVQRIIRPRVSHDPMSFFTSGRSFRSICLHSEDLTNVAWVKIGVTIGSNAIANPVDGLVTADKLIEDGTTGAHVVSQGFVKDTNSRFYNFSGWLKADGRNTCQIRLHGASTANRVAADIDLSTGSISALTALGTYAGGKLSLTRYLNSWFRFSISALSNADTSFNAVVLMTNPAGTTSYTGVNPNGIYLFGAMVEANAIEAGDYVRTQATAVEQEV
jgi:hypothetical protein